jgi:hypothetical protein
VLFHRKIRPCLRSDEMDGTGQFRIGDDKCKQNFGPKSEANRPLGRNRHCLEVLLGEYYGSSMLRYG